MSKEHDLLLAELIVKVAAIEKILMSKGILIETEYVEVLKGISKGVVDFISKAAKDGN